MKTAAEEDNDEDDDECDDVDDPPCARSRRIAGQRLAGQVHMS